MTTDAQYRKLNNSRRSVRPQYYDAHTGESKVISSSTEDALILTPGEIKKKAADYIKALVGADRKQQSADYNKLLEEVVTYQGKSMSAVNDEMEQLIGKFREFVDSTDNYPDTVGVSFRAGLQPLMSSMTRFLSSIMEMSQNSNFHGRFTKYMEEQHKRSATMDSTRELRSWLRVLMSYP